MSLAHVQYLTSQCCQTACTLVAIQCSTLHMHHAVPAIILFATIHVALFLSDSTFDSFLHPAACLHQRR